MAGLQASHPFVYSVFLSKMVLKTPAPESDMVLVKQEESIPFLLLFRISAWCPQMCIWTTPRRICREKSKNHQSGFYTVIQLIISKWYLGLTSLCACRVASSKLSWVSVLHLAFKVVVKSHLPMVLLAPPLRYCWRCHQFHHLMFQ